VAGKIYIDRHLKKDAWIDIFPDSDAYSGHTDVKGHELAFTYGVGKNVTLGIDYYYISKALAEGIFCRLIGSLSFKEQNLTKS